MINSKFFCIAAVGLFLSGALGLGANGNVTEEQLRNRDRTVSFGIVVFPGWEPLDVFGPLEFFFSMSSSHKMVLSIIAAEPGPVSAGYPAHVMSPDAMLMDFGHALQPKIQATHTFADAPALDILLIPGGMGNMALEQANDTSIEDFVALRFDQVEYILSVCTGAVSLALAGVLEGRRATTNKGSWSWVTSHGGEDIEWVPTARWTEDGKVWTSSGVAAGMDMTYAFLKHFYGEDDEVLVRSINGVEYAPHTDPNWDPFSVVHEVPGADPDADVENCVRPVGF